MAIEQMDQRLAEERARVVINALRGSGLQVPFGFDEDQAVELWAEPLRPFPMEEIIMASIGWWVINKKTFPTLEEFIRLCQKMSRQRRDEEAADNGGLCPECGDPPDEEGREGVGTLHWVRVEDGTENVETWDSKKARRKHPELEPKTIALEHHHYRPCSLCLPERYDLYKRGHWDADHEPCPQCRKYREPWRKL